MSNYPLKPAYYLNIRQAPRIHNLDTHAEKASFKHDFSHLAAPAICSLKIGRKNKHKIKILPHEVSALGEKDTNIIDTPAKVLATKKILSGSHPSHLIRHRNVLYFRMRVPHELQGVLGQREYRRSLKTVSQREAKRKASCLALILHEIFILTRSFLSMQKVAEVGAAMPVQQELTREKIQELARISLDRALNDTYRAALLLGPKTLEQKSITTARLTDELNNTLLNIDLLNIPTAIEEEADELLCEYGILNPKCLNYSGMEDMYNYKLLCDQLQRSKAAVLESQLAGPCWDGSLRTSNAIPVSMASNFMHNRTQLPMPGIPMVQHAVYTPVPKQADTAPILLREAIEKRLAESSPKWKSKATPMDKRNLYSTFMSIVGENTPMNKITRDEIRRYHKIMTSIPAQYKMKKKYSGMGFDELAELNVPAEKRFKRETLKNNFMAVRGFLSWAEEEGLIERAKHLNKLLSDLPEEAEGGQKRSFTTDELAKLFSPTLFMTSKEALSPDKPWKFLAPVIALFTGARIEEICQLELDDIRLEDGSVEPESKGIWYIHITNKSTMGGKDSYKSVKTKAGIRKVPLHPFLIGHADSPVNIPDYVENLRQQGETRLFPMLKPNSRGVTSDAVSKWFTRYRRKCGIGSKRDANSAVTFHSFRHTVVTTSKIKDVERRKVKQMVGHEAGLNDAADITARYEGNYPLSTILKDVIGVLDFDVTLNLYENLKTWQNRSK